MTRSFRKYQKPTYTIPYEKQQDTPTEEKCGAACMSMIMKSFGENCTQDTFWPSIKSININKTGYFYSTVKNIAKAFNEQKKYAISINPKNCPQSLEDIKNSNLRAILNIRPNFKAQHGHFVVFNDINRSTIEYHDPSYGENMKYFKDDFLELWSPGKSSEVMGHLLIAISPQQDHYDQCITCHKEIPKLVKCLYCQKDVNTQPRNLIGCFDHQCKNRKHVNFFCYHCESPVVYSA